MAIASRSSIKKFQRSFEERVAHARNGQVDMFSELSVEAVRKAFESDRRAIVLPELVQGVHVSIHYLQLVISMDEQGMFGEDTIFSLASPNRITQAMVEALRQALPILRERVSAERHQDDMEVLREADELLGELVPA